MFTEIKAAAISFRPRKYDLEANSHHLEKAFRQAAQKGAELALAPEGILEGTLPRARGSEMNLIRKLR